jgi:hypothetical protein
MKKWLAFLLGVSVLAPHAASAGGALNTISATINGSSSVSVAPGSSLEAMVTTELTGGADWNGTEWALGTSIATPLTCADTENFNTNGIHGTTFTKLRPRLPEHTMFISGQIQKAHAMGYTKAMFLFCPIQ